MVFAARAIIAVELARAIVGAAAVVARHFARTIGCGLDVDSVLVLALGIGGAAHGIGEAVGNGARDLEPGVVGSNADRADFLARDMAATAERRSASGLQKALAKHLAETICATIREAVIASRSGIGKPRDVVDLTFDAFDREGAGALASWMLLSGNEDALDPIVETIHDLVVDLEEYSSDAQRSTTLALTLMALGDAQMGGPLAKGLELPRTAARDRAEQMLIEGIAAQQATQAD